MGRRLDQAMEVVYIVEDDDAARALFISVVRSMGLGCEAFASAAEFLLCCDALRPGCLVLDLVMPDLAGREYPARDRSRPHSSPLARSGRCHS
jgi:FixJ family two-component response regulator